MSVRIVNVYDNLFVVLQFDPRCDKVDAKCLQIELKQTFKYKLIHIYFLLEYRYKKTLDAIYNVGTQNGPIYRYHFLRKKSHPLLIQTFLIRRALCFLIKTTHKKSDRIAVQFPKVRASKRGVVCRYILKRMNEPKFMWFWLILDAHDQCDHRRPVASFYGRAKTLNLMLIAEFHQSNTTDSMPIFRHHKVVPGYARAPQKKGREWYFICVNSVLVDAVFQIEIMCFCATLMIYTIYTIE